MKFLYCCFFVCFQVSLQCFLFFQQFEHKDSILLIVLSNQNDPSRLIKLLLEEEESIHSLYNSTIYPQIKNKRNYLFFDLCNHSSAIDVVLELAIGKTYTKYSFCDTVTLATSLNEDTSKLISSIVSTTTTFYHIDFNAENKIDYESHSAPYQNLPLPYPFIEFIVQDLGVKNLVSLKITIDNPLYSLIKKTNNHFEIVAKKYKDLCIAAYTVAYNNSANIAKIGEELKSRIKLDNLFIEVDVGALFGLTTFLNTLKNFNITPGNVYIYSNELYPDMLKWNKVICENNKIEQRLIVHYGETLSIYSPIQTLVHFIGFRQVWVPWDYFFYEIIINKVKNKKVYVNLLNTQCHKNTIVSTALNEEDIMKQKRYEHLCPGINCSSGCEQKIQLVFVSQEKVVQRKSCVPCPNSYFKPDFGENQCTKCSSYMISNEKKTACRDPFYNDCLNVKGTQGCLLIIYSAFIFTYSVFIILTFLHVRHTAVVKTGNFFLSISQLICHCIISMSIPILYIGKPSFLSCSSRSPVIGFLFTYVVSSIFIKTRKYVTIFSYILRFSNKEKWLMNSKDIMIGLIFLIIQCFMSVFLLVKSKPIVKQSLNEQIMFRTFQCSTDSQFMVQVVYIGFLLLLCSTQCIRARKLPSYFNESTEITYSTLISCIILTCFFPIYYGNNEAKIQMFAVCILMLTVNLVIIAIMFTPKMYIIYIRPEKNTTRSVVTKLNEFSNVK